MRLQLDEKLKEKIANGLKDEEEVEKAISEYRKDEL